MFQLRRVHFTHVAGDDGRGFELFIDEATIPPVGITAVIGPSGSGKTTLLSLLSGFLRADIGVDGALRFAGRDMVASPRHAPGEVGFVFQSPMLLRPASGAANAIQGAMLGQRDLSRHDVQHLLTALDLNDDGGRLLSGRVEDHSGGEAQRIAVLRALLSDARAILCDEPTSSLDEKNAGAVLSAFREWAHHGRRPVIWVTHDLHHSAQYADHFLFLKDGQVRRPSASMQAALETGDLDTRVAVLQQLAAEQAEAARSQDKDGSAVISRSGVIAEASAAPRSTERFPLPSRWAFLRWTARAISTGTPRAKRLEARHPGRLTPWSEAIFVAAWQADGSLADARQNHHFLAQLWAYGRWGLSFVFIATLLQVVAALFLQSAAGTYYAQRLQDPAVARIGFEHVVESLSRRGGGDTPVDLTPSAIRAMTAELRDRMAPEIGSDAVKRILIHGRRHERTRLRFASGPCTRWVTFDTVILSPDDPLLNQIELDGPAPEPSLRADLDAGTRLSPALQALRQRGDSGAIIIDAALARQMREACGLQAGKVGTIEWVHSDAHRPNALTLPIVAIAQEMPPVHPFTPQIIVFEPDFQAQLQTSDTDAPGVFRVANLYFPIEMFDQAEGYLQEKGYTTVTDSRAAVRTLRQMAGLAQVLPIVIVLINAMVTVIIVSIVISHVLELNKRVFTLFNAYGYRFRDVLTVLLLHLLPAALLSILVAAAATCAVAWLLLGDLDQIGNPIQFALSSLFCGVILQTLLIVVIACVTVGFWWRHAGKNLSALLKE